MEGDDREHDRPRFGHEHACVDLHADEQEEENVHAEAGDLPEALQRENSRRLEGIARCTTDDETRNDDGDDGRRVDALGQERGAENEHHRREDRGEAVGRATQDSAAHGTEGCADSETSDDREEEGARRRDDVEGARGDHGAAEAHEHERSAVVEEALALHDRGETMGNADGAERDENADCVRDREERAQQERCGEWETEREGRDAGGSDESDRDAGKRERDDRPARLPQATRVGEERGLEDEEREEGDEDDLRIERRVRQHVREDQDEADEDERDVVRDAYALRADRHRRAHGEDEEEALEPLAHPPTLSRCAAPWARHIATE